MHIIHSVCDNGGKFNFVAGLDKTWRRFPNTRLKYQQLKRGRCKHPPNWQNHCRMLSRCLHLLVLIPPSPRTLFQTSLPHFDPALFSSGALEYIYCSRNTKLWTWFLLFSDWNLMHRVGEIKYSIQLIKFILNFYVLFVSRTIDNSELGRLLHTCCLSRCLIANLLWLSFSNYPSI